MSDLISSDEAKSLLGCDDATLQNYINNGTIRAQRVDGELMLQRDDVENLGATNPTTDSDDGTIILSGDSEDLSIDLGEVVDDGAQTVVEQAPVGDDSLTFGDELESVNFDDGGTQELSFDDAEATQDGLSFTDSNTAVNADVDETVVGTATATATDDFQTVDYGDEDEAEVSQSTVRRSVRSQRVREEDIQVHWIWPSLLILTTVLVAFFIVPYLVMGLAQNANLRSTDPAEGTATGHGATDNMWTSIAGTFAGFSVEPDRNTFQKINPGGQWASITRADPTRPVEWRYLQYLGDDENAEDRAQDFIIDHIVTEDSPEDPDVKILKEAQALGENGEPIATWELEAVNSGSTVVAPQDREYEVILKYND